MNAAGGEVGVVGAEEEGELGLEECCCASFVLAAIFSRNCCTAVNPCVCVGGIEVSVCDCGDCVSCVGCGCACVGDCGVCCAA